MTHHCRFVQKWDTLLYADCVEFCPFEPFLSLAVCGTYQLCESETAHRVGRLSLHSIDADNIDLTPIQLLDGPGILDVKWCRKRVGDNIICLAAANAAGHVLLYALDAESTASLKQHHVQSIGDDGRLALSCDWFDGDKICVSDSKGNVSCLSVASSNQCASSLPLESWKAHEYEAWVASFDRHGDGQLIYSGGDDSCFRLWDLRENLTSPAMTNKKAHEMGVTSIESSPFDCNLLATGRYDSGKSYLDYDICNFLSSLPSYDERLLLWDKRQMKTCTSETHLGGGVWKLKWDPDGGRHLLAATMHNGFHIINCSADDNADHTQPRIIASYREHSSLAYGCDWSRQPCSKTSEKMIATCSFYDHSLHVWTFGS